MTKHTSGKLTVNETWGTLEGEQGQEICAIHAADESGRRVSKQEAQANAARLALAWNCHDELVEALRKCKAIVENKDMPPSARMELVRDYATPVLAKVGGLK